MNRVSKHNLLNVFGYCIASPFLLFIAVPIFMVGNSPADYGFLNIKVLLSAGLAWSIGDAILLLLCYLGLAKFGRAGIALQGLRFLFWWVLVAGFLLPVTVSAGMVDAGSSEINVVNLLITAVAAIVLTWFSATAARQYLLTFAAVLAAFSLGTSTYTIVRSDAIRLETAPVEKSPATELSQTRNVLVISLDGLQGHIVAELLAERSDKSNAFKDFTLFKNALSQSPATQASMLGELFGVRDYKALGDSLDEVKDELDRRGLVDQIPLLRAEDAFQKLYPFGIDAKLDQSGETATADSIELLKFALARVGTRFAADNRISNAVASMLVSSLAEEGSDALAARLRNHAGPDWDKRLVAEVDHFDAFTNSLTVGDSPRSYRYLHFAFTHYPVDFDAQCEYRSDDKRWFDSNQNLAGLTEETRCGLSKMQQFLTKLQEIGAYEQTLIVFKSDHGHPTKYFNEPPYNLEINRHSLWGYSRYRPLLMIKPAYKSQARLAVQDDLVLLNDLARTICVHEDDPATDCEATPGQDLLSNSDSDGEYFLYVVPTRASSFTFDTHISVKIESRQVDPLDALATKDGIELREGRGPAD